MFDKMKVMLDMQKKMQEMKRELENTTFEIISSDGIVKITMSGTQEVKEVSITQDLGGNEKPVLEKAIKDVYNKGIKRSQEVAAEKMKNITGFNIPGLM